jgi:membrane peptidoglycan carboxypeptidase
VLSATYHAFAGDSHRNTATLSFQISRTMFCSPAKPLRRQLDELRTAEQLEQHFSPRELFTIYANRAYFGDDIIGVQSAALHFFGRNAKELTVPEAALLAGLVQSPSRSSPLKHPDRALQRRNEVLDAMVVNGTITASTATAAKSTHLGIINQSTSIDRD